MWLTGMDRASLLSAYRAVGRMAGLSNHWHKLNPDEVALTVLEWLQSCRSWLVVMDNVDDISVVDGLLPEAGISKHIILTTRTHHHYGIPMEGLEVPLLSRVEGVELLMRQVGLENNPEDEIHATEIVEQLGFLPLAIEQAAAFIRTTSRDYSSYLKIYNTNRKSLHKWLPLGVRSYTQSVATTWSTSLEVLLHDHPSAIELLTLLSFLNPDGISREFLEAGLPALERRHEWANDNYQLITALRALTQFSLIRMQPGPIISIHRLVQAVVIDNLSTNEADAWAYEVVSLCDAAFPSDISPETRETCRAFLGQVMGPLHNITIRSQKLANLLERIGLFLLAEGHFKDSSNVLREAVSIFQAHLGHEDLATLRVLSNFAETLTRQGKYKESSDIQEAVIETRRKVLGEEHPDSLTSLSNISRLYWLQGKLTEAAALQEKALEASIRVLGNEHPDTLTSRSNLASIYNSQDRSIEAEAIQRQVFDTRRRLLGDEHPDTLIASSTLAIIYDEQNRWEKAAQLLEHTTEVMRRVLGDDHPDTLSSTYRLGIAYQKIGRIMESEYLMKHALERMRSILGPEHPNTAIAMRSLHLLYSQEGQAKEASEVQEGALHLTEKPLESNAKSIDIATGFALTLPPPYLTAEIETPVAQSLPATDETSTSLRAIIHSEYSPIDDLEETFSLNEEDSVKKAETAEFQWWSRVNRHPADQEFHAELANSYANRNDLVHAVLGWTKLVQNHPNIPSLLSRLSQAYTATGDESMRISGWFRLWKARPMNIGLLRNLRDACNLRYETDRGRSNLSLAYVAWLGFFSLLSDWLLSWGVDEVDWWPLVSEDELMMLQPYMVKLNTRCVRFFPKTFTASQL